MSLHNLSLFTTLKALSPEFIDWEVTSLFYAALHRVQEYAVLRGGEVPMTHVRRLDYVLREMPEIHLEYYILHIMSRKARYQAGMVVTTEQRDFAERLCTRIMKALP